MASQAKQTSRSAASRRVAFLDAAELLFSRHGYEGTSIRAICNEAQSQPGHFTYHWGTKEALFRAVLERRLRPVVEQRIERLDAASIAANGEPTVRQLLDAYYGPIVELSAKDEDGTFVNFLLRTVTEPAEEVRRSYTATTDEASFRFIRLLRRALPHLDDKRFFWRLSVTIGGMMYATANRPAIERLTRSVDGEMDIISGAQECLAGLEGLLKAP